MLEGRVKRINTDIVIHATPQQVWKVLIDFMKYPDWNPFIRHAAGDIAIGARLDVRIHPPGGQPMKFRPMIRAVSPNRDLRWLGHLGLPGLFDGEHVFQLESLGTDRTHVRHSEEFRGLLVPIVPNAVFARIRRGFEGMNRALRDRLETPA
jgi:hypothetical protein